LIDEISEIVNLSIPKFYEETHFQTYYL